MKINRENFFENVIPDLRDNLKRKNPPPLARESLEHPSEAGPLVERLFPKEIRESLLREVSVLEPGFHRARIVVGEKKKKNRHPHDFIIDTQEGKINLYFIDPEHQLGKSNNDSIIPFPRRGNLRPKVVTLFGIQLKEEEEIPDISILRFRAAAVADPYVLKMTAQLGVVIDLLKTGEVPDFLRGKENEITFRLNIRGGEALVQSRYADSADLIGFLHGEKSAPALEGKANSSTLIMGHFLKYLREGKFQRNDSGTVSDTA